MRPQCRGWHPTCSSRRRWVPALITWLVLIRRRDGVWWRCAASRLFLLFSGPIDPTGPLCRRRQMSSSLSFFIKLKRIALTDAIILRQGSKSATSGHFPPCLLPDLLRSFLQDPGNLDKIPQVRGCGYWKSNKDFHMSHMRSETTAGSGSEDAFQYMHTAISAE